MTIPHTSALEGGIRPHRIDSIQESSGTIDASGTWAPFSSVTKRCDWSPDAGMIARRGIGSVDALGHDTGVETHALTVAYLLQGTLESGTPLYEAFHRDADGLIETRTIVDRETHAKGGTDSNGFRVYTVAEGAKPATARLTGDPGSPEPMVAEIVYHCEKVRSYHISQPAAAATLIASGSGTITVEDDDGVVESFAGTSTAEFTSIDAAYLIEGALDSTIEVTNGNTSEILLTIYGSEKYNGVEGDRGVPTDATRVADWFGTDTFEKFLGDTITYGGGNIALDINSLELSIDNSLASTPKHNTLKQRITEGNRVVQVTATVMGEDESHDQIMRHLQNASADIVWTLDNATITVEDAALITPGNRVVESEGAFMQLSNVFEGTTIAIA